MDFRHHFPSSPRNNLVGEIRRRHRELAEFVAQQLDPGSRAMGVFVGHLVNACRAAEGALERPRSYRHRSPAERALRKAIRDLREVSEGVS